jgi:hypothetical protein
MNKVSRYASKYGAQHFATDTFGFGCAISHDAF